MNHRMRQFAALTLSAGLTAAAQAQPYPNRPISYVVASTAGGGAEAAFRPIADQLSKVLGQPVVMDFKPGAGGDIAALYIKSAAPDGYTVYAASNQFVVRSVMPNARFDARKDFTHISPSGWQPFIIAVNAEQIRATTVRDLIAEARGRPGQINYASYGVGSGAHMLMELLLHETGAKMTHVPYKSTAGSVSDTVGGRTQVVIGIMPTLAPHVASEGGSGKLRILAVTTQQRSPVYPNIPSMKDEGFKLDYMGWSGFVGPPGMSTELVGTLNRAYNATIKDPATMERLQRSGSIQSGGTPQQLTDQINREYNDYKKLIDETGLKLE